MTPNVTDEALDADQAEQAESTLDDEQMAYEEPAAPQSLLARLLCSLVVRILVLVVVLFVVAVVIVNLVYSSSRASRNQALPVDIYPGATMLDKNTSSNAETVTYTTPAGFQLVYAFYAQHITSSDGSGCQKVYYGKTASEDPGKVSGKCYILNAFQDANQYLSVSIQTQMDGDKPGKTLIVVERSWKG